MEKKALEYFKNSSKHYGPALFVRARLHTKEKKERKFLEKSAALGYDRAKFELALKKMNTDQFYLALKHNYCRAQIRAGMLSLRTYQIEKGLSLLMAARKKS